MNNQNTKLKICGIRTKKIAQFCENNQVDFAGFNFVPISKRKISIQKAKEIRSKFKNTKVVGVFQKQNLELVNQIALEVNLDYVQLHGEESIDYCQKIQKPIILAIGIDCQEDLKKIKQYAEVAEIFIFDNKKAGSGEIFPHEILTGQNIEQPFMIAGGVNPDNAQEIIKKFHPFGLDTASGVEKNGEISEEKIMKLIKICKN